MMSCHHEKEKGPKTNEQLSGRITQNQSKDITSSWKHLPLLPNSIGLSNLEDVKVLAGHTKRQTRHVTGRTGSNPNC